MASDLAYAYVAKALAMSASGDHRRTVALHDQAVVVYERMVKREGRPERRNDLAVAYMNKAIAVSASGTTVAPSPCTISPSRSAGNWWNRRAGRIWRTASPWST